MFIAQRLDTLNRVHTAIRKWHDLADQELEDFRLDVENKWNNAWDEHGYDPVGDEAFMLTKSEQALWGSFAVAIFATIEDSLSEFCTAKGIALSDRATWGEMKNKIENNLDVNMSAFAGFADVDRLRIVANCFKHNGGKANDDYANKYQCEKDSVIELEYENWEQHIQRAQEFLTTLSARL